MSLSSAQEGLPHALENLNLSPTNCGLRSSAPSLQNASQASCFLCLAAYPPLIALSLPDRSTLLQPAVLQELDTLFPLLYCPLAAFLRLFLESFPLLLMLPWCSSGKDCIMSSGSFHLVSFFGTSSPNLGRLLFLLSALQSISECSRLYPPKVLLFELSFAFWTVLLVLAKLCNIMSCVWKLGRRV